MSAEYRDDLLDFCDRRLAGDPFILSGKMMGHPGYKTATNGKFFLFLYEDGLALKMPPELYLETVVRDDVAPFQPGNDKRPMSTWIVWSCPEPEDYVSEWDLVLAARDYTAAEPPNPPRKRRNRRV